MGTKIKIRYYDLPEDLKNQLHKEHYQIDYEYDEECLYNTIVYGIGSAGNISNTLGVSFGLVIRLRDLNY